MYEGCRPRVALLSATFQRPQYEYSGCLDFSSTSCLKLFVLSNAVLVLVLDPLRSTGRPDDFRSRSIRVRVPAAPEFNSEISANAQCCCSSPSDRPPYENANVIDGSASYNIATSLFSRFVVRKVGPFVQWHEFFQKYESEYRGCIPEYEYDLAMLKRTVLGVQALFSGGLPSAKSVGHRNSIGNALFWLLSDFSVFLVLVLSRRGTRTRMRPRQPIGYRKLVSSRASASITSNWDRFNSDLLMPA